MAKVTNKLPASVQKHLDTYKHPKKPFPSEEQKALQAAEDRNAPGKVTVNISYSPAAELEKQLKPGNAAAKSSVKGKKKK